MTSVITRCTLEAEPSDGDGASRFKKMNQSLRQSMRRIRSSFRSKSRSSGRNVSGRRPKTLDKNDKINQANKKLQEGEFGRERQVNKHHHNIIWSYII
jgi:hypothetical protein